MRNKDVFCSSSQKMNVRECAFANALRICQHIFTGMFFSERRWYTSLSCSSCVLDSVSAIIIIQKLHTIFGSFGDRWIFVLSAKGDIFVARETNWCCIIAVSAYCCFQIVCCCVFRSGFFWMRFRQIASFRLTKPWVTALSFFLNCLWEIAYLPLKIYYS